MRFKIIAFLLFYSMYISQTACAQNRYALLVGINKWMKIDPKKSSNLYSRPENIKDLSGCLNDINVIAEILKGRFSFVADNIYTLKDQEATRDGILKSLDEMKNKCGKGDVFFFFFSGHGSQEENELSTELDKMDETICPYDAILHYKDIRDKEIATILQGFLDKGVIVTAMFESCHSGSIARGIGVEEKMASTSNDIVNDDKVSPLPGKNGALILSAAQEYQTALCKLYDNKVWQGCFTKAFMEVMQKSKADISATDLFSAVSAYLKNSGDPQIPAIEANDERLKAGLFGTKTNDSVAHIAVEKKLADNTVILQGGIALGLDNGTELVSADKKIKLEVTGNPDFTKSSAKVISDNSSLIKPGMLFSISRYGCKVNNKLQLCMPTAVQSKDELIALANEINKIVTQKEIKIITDYTLPADYLLFCGNGEWKLNANGIDKNLGTVPGISVLNAELAQGKSIKILWPLYKDLATKVNKLLVEQYNTISTCAFSSSDYFICGSIAGSNIAYACVKSVPDTSSLASYPLKSDQYSADNEDKFTEEICKTAWKLGKIKAWLTLDNKNNNTDDFPYQLYIKNNRKKGFMQDGAVRVGEQYTMSLIKTNDHVTTKKRWVYVFDIATNGSIVLLYPQSMQNSDNYLPAAVKDTINIAEMNIDPPYGTDNLIMLATEDPITNPSRLQQDGIVTKSVGNEIDAIVDNMNVQTRSVNTVKTTNEWSIQKMTFKIMPK